jgi:hypothetical protein
MPVYEELRPTFTGGSSLGRRYDLDENELRVADGGKLSSFPLTTLRSLRLRRLFSLYQCRAYFEHDAVVIQFRGLTPPDNYASIVQALARRAPVVRGGSPALFALSAIAAAVTLPAAAIAWNVSGLITGAILGWIAWQNQPMRLPRDPLPVRLLPPSR